MANIPINTNINLVHGILLLGFHGCASGKKKKKKKKKKKQNHLPMQETGVQSLGRENPMEEGTAIHSSFLAWKTPWAEEPNGLWSTGSQRVRHD